MKTASAMAAMPKTEPTQIKARRFRVVINHLYLRMQCNYRRAQETYQRIIEDNCYEENSLQSGESVLRQRNYSDPIRQLLLISQPFHASNHRHIISPNFESTE